MVAGGKMKPYIKSCSYILFSKSNLSLKMYYLTEIAIAIAAHENVLLYKMQR